MLLKTGVMMLNKSYHRNKLYCKIYLKKETGIFML